MNKIFISHSSKDIDYVRAFVEHVLVLGLGINADRIFCSSMEGQGVTTGQYIPDRLKAEMKQSCLALLFISRNFKQSEVCLNEVGAAWVTLSKEKVIPFLLPNTAFSELGFLDLNRLGLKIYDRNDLRRFIQDCRDELNPQYKHDKLEAKLDDYLNIIKAVTPKEISIEQENSIWDDHVKCFDKTLFPFDHIIRKAIPAYDDGIHRIDDVKLQGQIMTDLSKENFLNDLWYRDAEGDYYVEHIKRTSQGTWLLSGFNREIKIEEMWISMHVELQYEFILIKPAIQPPYRITSDVGGESYSVGALSDGAIISENERLNGYAIINGERIAVYDFAVEPRTKDANPGYAFIASDYHKIGFNSDEAMDFCEKLDSGEIEVNQENIMKFLRGLTNHSTVTLHR